MIPELRSSDLEAVRTQLGREPSTPFSVVCRCTGGHPLVIRNSPLDASGDPFPTTFWLTCPEAVKRVSRIESDGQIARLNERVELDEAFDEAVEAAHSEYARERARMLEDAIAWGGVGGTRTGVKCLHAHYANHLAGGRDPVGALVAEQVEPVHDERRGGRVAAIDQGTNSIRLIVVEPDGDQMAELARDMVITRLGAGVAGTGRLDPAALARTVEVLARYCRRARALGAERIRVAATSAVRDASNREELAAAVAEHAGSSLEVIDGVREAELSFVGGTRGLDALLAPPPYLVVDIGGGSTEFVVGTGDAERAISTQMGSVRLTEALVSSDPVSPADVASMETEASRVIEGVVRDLPALARVGTFVSVAGTATTLQAIALGLERYDPDAIHRTWLTLSDAEGILIRLAAMTNRERSALPVMAPGRGDVIVAGAVILVTAMRRLGFERTLVSETDILDGLALEMLSIGYPERPDAQPI
jgi:exopolyphosphatase / guanosine-5'-triphosphate,3'-diphosphate pyrophosphatase